jgi:hypothetical protein
MFNPSCGGGGGSGGAPIHDSDPIIPLIGPVAGGGSGRLSRTIDEANRDAGANPPPSLPASVAADNHWIRLEFPFPIDPSSVLENSPATAPFSYLNGNVTITDPAGDHVPGLALVNGVDVFGVSHATEDGFPHDVQGMVDRNVGPNVLLYVADVDGDLSTRAALGYQTGPPNDNSKVEIQDVASHVNGALDTIRVAVGEVNGRSFHGVWTFHLGSLPDLRRPAVLRIDSETKDPTQPLNDASADVSSSFIVEFSKLMVPKSVGKSAALNGTPYNANLPLAPFVAPFPNVALTATVNTAVGTLFVPFDCNPINSNNLATYRLRPLVDLPASTSLDVVVRAITTNTNAGSGIGDAPIDLAANPYDGQDGDGDGLPDGADLRRTFSVGPGAALVNIPVSPEVIYWLPSGGDGIGAIDLNGRGITTNAPGANAGDRSKAILITKRWLNGAGCEVNPGGWNPVSGIGLWAHPGDLPTPTDPCTNAPMLEFGHNRYHWPLGTGSFAYGPVANQSNGEDIWKAPNDPGNPGTPFPGVNEGSSGFETLCRDSSGEVILTGRQFGRVGTITDLIVGEFLDVAYYDSVNFKTNTLFHVSFFNGGITGRGNTIADPPTPNPPPLRYWVGLPTIGVVIDQANPTAPPLLLEGDEVFCGFRYVNGFQQLEPNTIRPDAPDQTVFPHFAVGPGFQSASAIFTFSSRQQIGNFLYATDATSREVHAINSNTMRVIASIATPDPSGLGISPDLSRLFVSNSSHDNVSVIACDPLRPSFHREIARISVGSGPRAICVQPDHEDVLVCNFNGNSVSIVNATTLVTRKSVDALISSPIDIEATPRQNGFGWGAQVWFAYISNLSGNSVAVYESGPDGPQGVGIDNIRGTLPTSDQPGELIEPRGLSASPLSNALGLLAGGCVVAHRDEDGFGRVTHLQFTHQAIYGPLPLAPPPGFFIPPGFLDRQVEITGSWGNEPSNRLISNEPVDVAFADLNVAAFQSSPSLSPNLGAFSVPPNPDRTGRINSKHPIRGGGAAAVSPDRLYVAFADTDSIQVLAAGSAGVLLGIVPGPGFTGVKKVVSYWRQ